MRINIDVSGYYDWVPVPPGTKVTEDDVAALRAKKMTDDAWHMRVTMNTSTHHDVGIHEESICQRMAALEKLGRGESREQVVAGMLQSSLRHHLSPSHMTKINVHDDGPIEETFRSALIAAGVEDSADAIVRYLEASDLEGYLNTVFKTASTKAKKGSK